MDDKLIDFAAQAITQYLTAHPGSMDTIEGIHNWWIEWPIAPEAIDVTREALARLAQAGVVEKRVLGNREVWHRPRTTTTD